MSIFAIQETVAQNYALGKPLDEGVDQAAVMGMLSGGAMGAGMQLMGGQAGRPQGRPAVARCEHRRRWSAARGPPATPPLNAPVAMTPELEKELLDKANRRIAELNLKAKKLKFLRNTPPENGRPESRPGLPWQ